jgi:hypothetical protein
MIKDRGNAVGLPDLYPHQLRHTFSHDWLANGDPEGDLTRLTLAAATQRPMQKAIGQGAVRSQMAQTLESAPASASAKTSTWSSARACSTWDGTPTRPTGLASS